MPKINILKVKSNHEKLQKLCQTVQYHFEKKEQLLIAVPNEEVARYIDQLLWKLPQDSFLPHKIASKECDINVIITTSMSNLNQAKVLINLLPGIHPLTSQFQIIYELYDETDPAKEMLSKERLEVHRRCK